MFIRAFKPWLHPDLLFDLSPLGKLQKKCLKVLHGMTKSVIRTRKEQLTTMDSESSIEEHEENMEDLGMYKRKIVLS